METGAGVAGAQGQKLLLIDDDAPLRRNMARALEREGFTVAVAASLKEAYEVAAEFQPDALHLPRGDLGEHRSDTYRAGERNHVHTRIFRKNLSSRIAVAGDDIEHAIGDARFTREFRHAD